MRSPAMCALVLLLSVAACDRMPADPLESDAVAALSNVTGERPAPHTLSGLVYTSIRTVHVEHGSDAALALVRDLARIQQRLDVASGDDAIPLWQELRSEQLRIVLLVQGNQAIERTAAGVERDAAMVSQRIDALTAVNGNGNGHGHDAVTVLDTVATLVAAARSATDDARALDAVTRAGAMLDRLRLDIASVARLPSLADLARDASTRLDAASQPLAAEYQRLVTGANEAVQAGESEETHDAVTAARAAQIEIVLATLGSDGVTDMIARGRTRGEHIAPILKDFADARDVSRLERMSVTAVDMLIRADARLRDGDSAGALDLAAHATDLLNALDAALISR